MKTRQSFRRHHGYADPHELLPGRFSHTFEILALIAIVAGDAVAFQQVVAVAMEQSPTSVTWTLILALSAAATVSMHLSGVAARRRHAGAHQAGPLWSWCVIFTWLALGGMALWFRLANAAAHVAPATSSGVFGTIPATGAATAAPMAALMLGLYLVGGMTAYGIGYAMHNPARSAYLRARRECRRAERAFRWATWRRERALVRNSRPTSGLVSQRIRGVLTPGPPAPVGRVSNFDAATTQPSVFVDTPEEHANWRDRVVSGAQAQAEQLREVARHRLATALAEPARTTGVFDGHLERPVVADIDMNEKGRS